MTGVTLDAQLLDGQAPPGQAPPEQALPGHALTELGRRAVLTAAEWVQAGRRVDMQGLARDLDVSRVTLFRHVGGREALLARALWTLTARTLDAAERRWPPGSTAGSRAVAVMRVFNELVSAAPGLRRLLDDEPALAIRVLTDPRGAVQPGVVARVEQLLRQDEREGVVDLLIEPGALSFALVRLGESFLYADALASRTPDVETANRLQRALVEGGR
jgi:AcrR family transcriptional regulator